MANEWKEVTVNEIAAPVRNALVGGPFGSNLVSADYVTQGVPVIRGQNLGERWVSGEFAYVSDAKADSLSGNLARPGDIVFTQRGTLGQVGLVPDGKFDRYLVSQSQMKLTVNNEIADPVFCYYQFCSDDQQDYMRLNAIQTGVPHTNLGILRSTPFLLPPLSEQRAIASIIGSLDDKIDLNRRMNETLEAMARALFKDWFVDFGPTRAKMEGRAPYLAPEIWALFPDRLDEEGKPEGWEVSTIGQCFKLTMGQSPPGDTYNNHGEGLPFFQGRTDFGFRYPENRKYCSSPSRIADPEDTLVSVRAPVGDINLAWEKCCIGRGVAALRHKSGFRSFTYYSAWAIQGDLKQYEHTGTVFGAINKNQFESLKVVVGNTELTSAFESLASPLDDRLRANVTESRTLAQTRDLLLPKLMSGEIRVKDAEKTVENVL